MKKKKIKKVLIALDFDPTAQKVAEAGFALAKSMNSEVILLHVVLDLVYYSLTYMNMGPMLIDSVAELKDISQHFLEITKKHLGDETIQTIIKEGDCTESILNTAKDIHADIIVIGSHSRKWLDNILMGSVTEKVLHNTTLPLFIVPTKKNK
jgi:nucleotide-binding universal stress UspA family protein